MTEQGYLKAQSDNLPKVDSMMIAEFFSKSVLFSSAEIRGVKAKRSGHESYGDSAVGYVQIKRDGGLCTVKARICPEHKVRNKNYNVSLEIDELAEEVLNVTCHDCAASAGGCKHAIAFLMWVHRRSEDPAPTEVECYWKKSKLATVGTTLKFIKVKDFGVCEDLSENQPSNQDFLQEVIAKGLAQGNNSQILKYFENDTTSHATSLGLHHLLHQFVTEGGTEVDKFLNFVKEALSPKICEEACNATVLQSNCKLWHELRYGRVTASKIYEVSRCKLSSGSLVETVVGSKKNPETKAMVRGKILEKKVLQVLQEETKIQFKEVGFLISQDYPFLGASPDAISPEFVVEIKCPTNMKTMQFYIKDNKITNKCNAQIQLQMLLFRKKRGIFCVADPAFEITKKIDILYIDFDEDFIDMLVSAAHVFWCKNIFPILLNSLQSKS